MFGAVPPAQQRKNQHSTVAPQSAQEYHPTPRQAPQPANREVYIRRLRFKVRFICRFKSHWDLQRNWSQALARLAECYADS